MTDAQALALLEDHGDMALRLCTRLAGAEGEDLFQEAIVRLLPLELRESDAQATRNLLYTICLNLYRNQYAKRRRWKRLLAEAPDDFQPAGKENTEAQAITHEERTAARVAVSHLADRYRLPIELYYFAGWSTAQIADALSTKETTIRANLHRARKKLRKELEEWL